MIPPKHPIFNNNNKHKKMNTKNEMTSKIFDFIEEELQIDPLSPFARCPPACVGSVFVDCPSILICGILMHLDEPTLYEASNTCQTLRYLATMVITNNVPNDVIFNDLTQRKHNKGKSKNYDLGGTALHTAALNGSYDIVEKLLMYDADPNLIDNMKRTPLHWAALHNHGLSVRALLNAGANPLMKDKAGKTPLALAQTKEHAEIITMLLAVKDNNIVREKNVARNVTVAIRKISGYYDDFNNIKKEVNQFASNLNHPSLMPTQDSLIKAKVKFMKLNGTNFIFLFLDICVFIINLL